MRSRAFDKRRQPPATNHDDNVLAVPHRPEAGVLLLVGGLLAFIASFLPYERVSSTDTYFGPPDPPVVVMLSQDVGDLVHNSLTQPALPRIGITALALVAALVCWGVPSALATAGGTVLVQRGYGVPRRRTRVLIRVLVGAVWVWLLLDTAVYLALHALDAQDTSTMQEGYWVLLLSYLCALVGAIRLPGIAPSQP